jgi:hypothetical protein
MGIVSNIQGQYKYNIGLFPAINVDISPRSASKPHQVSLDGRLIVSFSTFYYSLVCFRPSWYKTEPPQLVQPEFPRLVPIDVCMTPLMLPMLF